MDYISLQKYFMTAQSIILIITSIKDKEREMFISINIIIKPDYIYFNLICWTIKCVCKLLSYT